MREFSQQIDEKFLKIVAFRLLVPLVQLLKNSTFLTILDYYVELEMHVLDGQNRSCHSMSRRGHKTLSTY